MHIEPPLPPLGAHVRVVRAGGWFWRCPHSCGGHGSIASLDVPDELIVCKYEATPDSGPCGRLVPRSAYRKAPPFITEGRVAGFSSLHGQEFVDIAPGPTGATPLWPYVLWSNVLEVTVLS